MNSIRIPMNLKPYPAPPTNPIDIMDKRSLYQRALDSWKELQKTICLPDANVAHE